MSKDITISVPIDSCKHLKVRSVYNHNFYQLPFSINGMSILLESSDDDNSITYYLYQDFGSDNERVPIGGDSADHQIKTREFILQTEDYGRHLT